MGKRIGEHSVIVLDIWIFTCKRIKLDIYFTSYMKTNPKWINDHMNIRAKYNTLRNKCRGESL